MSDENGLFNGWLARSYCGGQRFVIAPKEFWERTGRPLCGNPGGDIPGFTFSGYELTPKTDNRNPVVALESLGFEVR